MTSKQRPKTRKFNGKVFKYYMYTSSKTEYNKIAKSKRKQGYQIRLVKQKWGKRILFNLYIRGRKK